MAKIGIMGGTFNPVHLGHIAIAKAAYRQFHLDEVWFMPNHIPAYKSDEDLISGEMRLAMVQLAIQNESDFKVSDFEIKRDGKTYTYETMQLLKQRYPENDFFFILGADSLFYLEKWVHPEIIVENAIILAACRNNRTVEEMTLEINRLNYMFGKKVIFLIDCPEFHCSSSEIREQVQKIYEYDSQIDEFMEIITQQIPASVFAYIMEHHLYEKKHKL